MERPLPVLAYLKEKSLNRRLVMSYCRKYVSTRLTCLDQLFPKVIAALLVGPMESERNVSLLPA